MIYLSALSMFVLVGCGTKVERPDANATWVNARSLSLTSYNLKKDYDANGIRLPNAKPVIRSFESCEQLVEAINVSMCIDPAGQREVKRAQTELVKTIQLMKERCGSACWGL